MKSTNETKKTTAKRAPKTVAKKETKTSVKKLTADELDDTVGGKTKYYKKSKKLSMTGGTTKVCATPSAKSLWSYTYSVTTNTAKCSCSKTKSGVVVTRKPGAKGTCKIVITTKVNESGTVKYVDTYTITCK